IANANGLTPGQDGTEKNYKNLSWQKLLSNPIDITQLEKDGNGKKNIVIDTRGKNIIHGQNYIVRARYSLDKAEVEKIDGYAIMGEVEDYKVKGSYPIVWSITEKDLGIPIENTEVYFGANNDLVSHKEIVEYTITFINKSQTSMSPSNITYISNKAEYVINSISETNLPLETTAATIGLENGNYVLKVGNIEPGIPREVSFKVKMVKDERNKKILDIFRDRENRSQSFKYEYLRSNFG
uniref:hypothetical protein n=1 Tax=Fusobacterium mortiferum TaxID=850 RepID=UPI003FEFE983